MTKKQSLKKKISLKLNPGEAAFVADIEVMNHIINLYYEMSLSCEAAEDSQAWLNVMESIKTWCSETYYSPSLEDEYEEEW